MNVDRLNIEICIVRAALYDIPYPGAEKLPPIPGINQRKFGFRAEGWSLCSRLARPKVFRPSCYNLPFRDNLFHLETWIQPTRA
jgi:hypothetical protein